MVAFVGYFSHPLGNDNIFRMTQLQRVDSPYMQKIQLHGPPALLTCLVMFMINLLG